MNVKQLLRRRAQQRPRYSVNYEPDYDHDAWRDEQEPTPQSHPDAFFFSRSWVNMPCAKPGRCRERPESLSIGKIKSRLYQAGVGSKLAAEIAREIHRGPVGLMWFMPGGVLVMGWPIQALQERYGRRLTRAVTRFLHRSIIMMDESHTLVWLMVIPFDYGALPAWRSSAGGAAGTTSQIPIKKTAPAKAANPLNQGGGAGQCTLRQAADQIPVK